MEKQVSVLIVITLIAFSCSPKNNPTMSATPDAIFDNTRWKMVKIDGLDSFPRLPKDAFIQFNKTDNRFRGNAGCNNFTGGYTVDGKKLTLGNAAMTRMLCPDPGMKIEGIFSSMMKQIDSYEIKGDRLFLKSGNKVLAEFEALYL